MRKEPQLGLSYLPVMRVPKSHVQIQLEFRIFTFARSNVGLFNLKAHWVLKKDRRDSKNMRALTLTPRTQAADLYMISCLSQTACFDLRHSVTSTCFVHSLRVSRY